MTDSPPPPTPPPRLVAADDEPSQARHMGHECPYRAEIHTVRRLTDLEAEDHIRLVKRLAALDVEGQAQRGRSRSRWAEILAAVAITLVAGLGAWKYLSDVADARADEALRARVLQLEESRSTRESVTVELTKVNTTLSGLDERVGRFDGRLCAIEEHIREQGQRGRRR